MSDADAGMSDADAVWNRACFAAPGDLDRIGDRALAAALRAHSELMSGGMDKAVCDSLTSEEVTAAVQGFRFLGLENLAAIFEEAYTVREDEAQLDRLEEAYHALVPQDQVLVDAFEGFYRQHPREFAPASE